MGGPGGEDDPRLIKPKFGPPEQEPPDRSGVIDEAVEIIGPSPDDLEDCRADIDDALNIVAVQARAAARKDRYKTEKEADAARKAEKALQTIDKLRKDPALVASLPLEFWNIDVEGGLAWCEHVISRDKRNARSPEYRQIPAALAARWLLDMYSPGRKASKSTTRGKPWPRLAALLAGQPESDARFERICQEALRPNKRSRID